LDAPLIPLILILPDFRRPVLSFERCGLAIKLHLSFSNSEKTGRCLVFGFDIQFAVYFPPGFYRSYFAGKE
tara:strand:- start:3777 stop:3989 length:213 start_codon:yes stop_codon:yes gene_type:complete